MKILIKYLLLQIFCNTLSLITAQWCLNYNTVVKTRVQWNNGQRLTSKRNFFGGIKYKYEPYIYSTVQTYRDYERVTVCCDGYSKVSNTLCEPICSPSCPTNTHCIRPNTCECNTGYRGYVGSPKVIQCQPVCEPACTLNAQCTAPNKCTCNSGYQENDQGICQPICKECPANSKCIKPNQCSCNEGYLENDSGECKPVCSKTCPEYSECYKPEVCFCQWDYKMRDGKCLPICDLECPQNSQCVKPNECACNVGYEKTEVVNATHFKCLPKCDKGCPLYAECTQPNTCECQMGYEKTQENECKPICENGCPLNAICSETNKCTCNQGYEMLEQKCQPICEKSCPEHASCSEPNKCQCEAGYQMKLSSTYNLYCEPVCEPNCSVFGKCVLPNKCECLDGYEMDEMEICRPTCSRGCINGLCFQPEICICNPGYLMGPQDECEPACSMHCQNGSCVEPEICQCHEGFKFKDNSINICEPICDPQCINGICVAPNVCICHENHEPTSTATGLNHSNCQLIQTTTTAVSEIVYEETTTEETIITEVTTAEKVISLSTLAVAVAAAEESTTITHPDPLTQTTLSTLVSAEICNDQCQCWREFDEYGPLVSQKCTHLCVDDYDKPCLDLNLCQCNIVSKHLVCRTAEDSQEEDDPIFYMCHMERFKVTTFKPLEDGKSSDMKSIQTVKESSFPWWWPAIGGAFVVMTIIGGLIYMRCRKVEDPIMEYEL